MKMTKCDVCGKVVRDKEANLILFVEHADAAVMVRSKRSGEYVNVCDIERDVCRSCSIKILKMLFPNHEFLPENEYENNH